MWINGVLNLFKTHDAMMRLCVVLVLATVFIHVECRNPGFKARITQKGITYANDVAIQALTKAAETVKFPDISCKSGKFKYAVSNIKLTRFTPPNSNLSIVQHMGLQWRASGASVRVEGDFSYKAYFIKGSGSFVAEVSGVGFDLAIDIGSDETGRPSMAARHCSSAIGGVSITFHGSMSVLYNLFKSTVEKAIKKSLPAQLCSLVNNEINQDGEKKLSSIPVTVKLDKFLLDYRLTQPPTFLTSYLETYHKGEIYWNTSPDVEAPFSAPAMPDSGAADNMLYLWLSDYMFNTLATVAQQHGYLQYNLNAADLPEAVRGVLNTTCEGFIPKCVGALIPGIGQKYPNNLVSLRLRSSEAPNMSISPAGVGVNCHGMVDMYVHKPGNAAGSIFLASLNATMSTIVDVSISNEVLHAKVNGLKLNLKAVRSEVGPISDEFIDFLIKEALDVFLIPQLNELGAKGLPLPMTKEVTFQNSKISYSKDTVMVATDLSYKAAADEDVDEMDGPLKFEPMSAKHHDNKNLYSVQ